MSTIHHARDAATGNPLAVTTDGGRVTAVAPSADRPTAWVAPTFVDGQVNGCLGVGFNDPDLTPDGVRVVTAECRRHGVATYFPTVITDTADAARFALATLARAADADPEVSRAIPGFHLEGPYLAAADGPRGAHPREHVRDPDWDEFRRWQDAAGGRVRMVTLAPERPGAVRLIERLVAAGVVVAIGHTDATGSQLRDAVAAGATVSTHLGNGCHAVLPRHPNVLWEQLAADRLWASVIADGHHLPASVVKTVVRVKTPARVVLTGDVSPLAGLPPGRYPLWGQEFEVTAGGAVVVPGTPYLAGSNCFADGCVANAVRMAGVTLAEAVGMATARPRELFGLPPRAIAVGQPADLVVFDWAPGGDVVVRAVLS